MSEDLEPQNSEIKLRIITAIIAVAVVCGALWAGQQIFFIFVLAVAFAMSLELDKMRADGLKSFLLVIVPLLVSFDAALSIIIFSAGLFVILIYAKLRNLSSHWLLISLLIIYFPILSFLWIRGFEPDGLNIIIWIICIIAATDIGAYITGRAFGKNKLAPSISPGKTREGALGGLFFAALVGLIFSLNPTIIILSVVTSILSQAGDLLESAIKRHFGVKHSGNLLPGHGGVLDRIDGYILAVPFIAILLSTGLVQW